MNVGTEFATVGDPFVNPTYDYLVSDISSDSARLVLDAAARTDDIYLAYDEEHRIDLRPYLTTDSATVTGARSTWTDGAARITNTVTTGTSYNSTYSIKAILDAISEMEFSDFGRTVRFSSPDLPDKFFIYPEDEGEDCDTSALKEFLDGIEVREH